VAEILIGEGHREAAEARAGRRVLVEAAAGISLKGDQAGRRVMEGRPAMVLAIKATCLAMGFFELVRDDRRMVVIVDTSKVSTTTMMVVTIPAIMVTTILVDLLQTPIPTLGLRIAGILLLFLVFQRLNKNWFRRRQRHLRGSLLAGQNA
jgi:hypothetical protein